MGNRRIRTIPILYGAMVATPHQKAWKTRTLQERLRLEVRELRHVARLARSFVDGTITLAALNDELTRYEVEAVLRGLAEEETE